MAKKNFWNDAVMKRQAWMTHRDAVSVTQLCVQATVSHATVFAHQKQKPMEEVDLLHSHLIDEEYSLHSFYGIRKMVIFLKTQLIGNYSVTESKIPLVIFKKFFTTLFGAERFLLERFSLFLASHCFTS